jgi:hypothetical protein
MYGDFQHLYISVAAVKYFSWKRPYDQVPEGLHEVNEYDSLGDIIEVRYEPTKEREEEEKLALEAYSTAMKQYSTTSGRKRHWLWLKAFRRDKIKKIHVEMPSTTVKRLLPKMPFPDDIVSIISEFLTDEYYVTWIPFHLKYERVTELAEMLKKKNENEKKLAEFESRCVSLEHHMNGRDNPYYWFAHALETTLEKKILYIKNVRHPNELDEVYLHGPLRRYNEWFFHYI